MNDATLLELEALKTEREGLIAENLHRQSVGESMAYGDEAFDAVASRIRVRAGRRERGRDGSGTGGQHGSVGEAR